MAAPSHDAYWQALRPELDAYVARTPVAERLRAPHPAHWIHDAWSLSQAQPLHWGAHVLLRLFQRQSSTLPELLRSDAAPPGCLAWLGQRSHAPLLLWPAPKNNTPAILLPTYNRCALLQRAVQSVQQQSHRDWLLLICDDASNDATADYCRDLAQRDARVKVIRQSQNQGYGASMSRLYQWAETLGCELVCTLADDDLLLPDCLQESVSLYGRFPWIALAAGGYYLWNERLKDRPDWLRRYGPHYALPQLVDTQLELERCAIFNPVFGGGALIRRAALKQLSPADPLLGDAHYSGWDSWITQACLGHYDVAYSPAITAFHHVSKSGHLGDRPIWGAANLACLRQLQSRYEALLGRDSFPPWLRQRYLRLSVLPSLDYAIAVAPRFFRGAEQASFIRAHQQLQHSARAFYAQSCARPTETRLRPESVYGQQADLLEHWPDELRTLWHFKA